MTPASMGTKALFVASTGALVANGIARNQPRNREAEQKIKEIFLRDLCARSIRIGNPGVASSRTVKAPLLLCLEPGLSHILVTHTRQYG